MFTGQGLLAMFGVINIDKPKEYTSHDVVARVRKKLGFKKVGHCGTLDPNATGVLPVCIGQATRLIEYFPSDKRYLAHVTLGKFTTSWDVEGEDIAGGDASQLTKVDIEPLMQAFMGTVMQQVPPHAAVHVNGKKLYEYARKGIAVELPIRPVEIYDCKLERLENAGCSAPIAVISIHCASGTYVRSIAQKLGELTGVGAYLSDLVRTAHGQFTLDTSVGLEAFMDDPLPQRFFQNPASFLDFPQYALNNVAMERIKNGMKLQPLDTAKTIRNNQMYLLTHDNKPVAIAKGEAGGQLKPIKVLAQLQS